jgi:hypothetical protein
LTNLEEFVNSMAGAGLLPYWKELETRRLRSPHFNSDLFKEVPVKTDVVWDRSALWPVAWTNAGGQLKILCSGEVRGVTSGVSIVECQLCVTGDVGVVSMCAEKAMIQRDGLNKLADMSYRNTITADKMVLQVITSLFTGMGCGFEDYMTVRAFDESGKYVWQLPRHVGSGMVYCGDVTGDGLDDIVVRAIDHGTVTYHVFRQRSGP